MTTSTTPASTAPATPTPLRVPLLVGGIVSIGFGIAILVWPAITAAALTGVIAVYAVLAGVVYGAIGITAKHQSTGSRIGHVLLGLVFIVAGVFAFSSLQQTTGFLAVFVAVMIGVMWIVEGFTALFTLGEGGSKAATIIFAIISIVAGFVLLSSPLWSAVLLWWLLGIWLIVLGVLNAVRAFSKSEA